MQQNDREHVYGLLSKPHRLLVRRRRASGWLIGILVAVLALIHPSAATVWAGVPAANLARAPHAMLAQQQDEEEENGDATDPEEIDDAISSDAENVIDEEVTAEDDETIPLIQELGLTLDKSFTDYDDLDENGDLSADDVISYTFMITNTGNVTVNSVMLEDEMLELDAAECGVSTLAPDEVATCVYTYTLTLEDVSAGQLENEAVATALGPDDTEISATASTTIVLPQLPGLSLEKAFGGYIDMDEDGALGLNDIITYTFTLTNTGNVALESIALNDALLELEDVVCGESTLEPQEETGCEYVYTVTQDDMDAGEIYNAASVTGTVAPTETTNDEP